MTKYESRYGSADPTLLSRWFYRFVWSLIWGAGKIMFRIEVHGQAYRRSPVNLPSR